MKRVTHPWHTFTLATAIVAMPALVVTVIAHSQGQANESRLYWGLFVGAILTWGAAATLTVMLQADPVGFLLDERVLAMDKNKPLSWEWLTRRLVLVMLACITAATTSIVRIELRSYASLWLTAAVLLLVASLVLSVLGSLNWRSKPSCLKP